MKLSKVLASLFILSVLIAAVIFFGTPIVISFVETGKTDLLHSDILLVGMAMYLVYLIIQLLLSATNVIQASRLIRRDAATDPHRMLFTFLGAELILYVIFFLLFTMAFDLSGAGLVLLFSIPYIICCTVSVFLFRYFLTLDQKPQPYESQNDTAGIS